MEVKINRLPGSQIEFEIEVPVEEFNNFIERATLNLGENLEIKGFRKGNVPKDIVEKEIGPEKILVEAADLAIKENYKRAVLENKIEVISQPEIKIKKMARGNPLVFLAKTAILPEIKLGNYKKIAVKIKKKEIVVTEKEIDDALRWLQKSRAKFTLKNRAAEKGDFVEIEYWLPQINAKKEGFSQKDAFILGEGRFIPGFEEQLVGMKAGEEKKGVSITIPENQYRNLFSGKMQAPLEITKAKKKHRENKSLTGQGKKVVFRVKMNLIQNIELPEINNQFAQSLGDFKDLIALKENIKKGLNLEKDRTESQRVRNEILDKINEATDCEIPEILIKREQNQMIENFKKNVSENLNPVRDSGDREKTQRNGISNGVKISFEEYLKKLEKTEKEILDSFLPEAQKKIKNFFILREIGEREQIEVSETEIREEVNKILEQYPSVKGAQKELDPERLKEYTKEVIKNEKIFQLLEDLA